MVTSIRSSVPKWAPGLLPGEEIASVLLILRGSPVCLHMPTMKSVPAHSPRAVLQCCCFQSPPAKVQSDFSQYFIDILKIVCDMAQKEFFSSPIPRAIRSNVSNIYTEIENFSIPKTSR
jgi:hypothetical protein